MKVQFTLSIGYPGADHEEVVDCDDEATDTELQEAWQEWTYNYIDGGYERMES